MRVVLPKDKHLAVTYNIHEGEEIILHMLFAMKSNHRVINPQQDLDVVVVLPGISAVTAAMDSLINLLSNRVQSPGYIQLWFCERDKTREVLRWFKWKNKRWLKCFNVQQFLLLKSWKVWGEIQCWWLLQSKVIIECMYLFLLWKVRGSFF